MLDISVVVPVYQCRECLAELHRRLTAALTTVTSRYEIILVEDRGRDCSWEAIEGIVAADARVRGFRLSRNFGQHAAITAGLSKATGSWTIVMDCDLQDPPEDIPRLFATAQQGYDIVLARREARQHSLLRRWTASAYFKVLSLVAGQPIGGEYGTFSIISRKVVDAFLSINDIGRHYLLVLRWLGFATTSIPYDHANRFAGASSYSPGRLIKHALDGLMFQSTAVLTWIVYVGFGISALAALAGLVIVIQWAFFTIAPGWPSLAVLTLLIGGFIIMSTGIAALYIGRIFDQVKGRPLYVISDAAERQ